MDNIEIRNISTQLPACWNDLTKRNLLFLAKRFPYPPTRGFSLSFFIHALNLWRNHRLALAIARNIILSKKLNRLWKNDAVIEWGETNFFEQQIIITVENLNNFKWLQEIGILENCLVNSFRIGFVNYYGPANLLANVTADEFSNADDFLLLFLEEKEEKYLDYLIAVLWREKSRHPKTEDVRVVFSEFEVKKRVAKIKKLSPKIKNACLLNYVGLRNYFLSRETSKIVFSNSGYAASETANWGTIILRLAENQTFGTHLQVKKSYIHDVIDHLADLKKRNKE